MILECIIRGLADLDDNLAHDVVALAQLVRLCDVDEGELLRDDDCD